MSIGFEVGEAMSTMNDAERRAYARGLCLAYSAVFRAFSETSLAGKADAATVFAKVSAQFDAALSAQTVRGVL